MSKKQQLMGALASAGAMVVKEPETLQSVYYEAIDKLLMHSRRDRHEYVDKNVWRDWRNLRDLGTISVTIGSLQIGSVGWITSRCGKLSQLDYLVIDGMGDTDIFKEEHIRALPFDSELKLKVPVFPDLIIIESSRDLYHNIERGYVFETIFNGNFNQTVVEL